jgi:hypothetical protein
MTNDLRTILGRGRWRTSDPLIDGFGYSFVQMAIPLSSLRFPGFNTTASTTSSDHRYCHRPTNMSVSSYLSTKRRAYAHIIRACCADGHRISQRQLAGGERPLLAHCRFALASSSSRFGYDSEFITATIYVPHRSPSGLGWGEADPDIVSKSSYFRLTNVST